MAVTFGIEALLLGLFPEVREVRRVHERGEALAAFGLELVDDAGVVLGAAGDQARVDPGVAGRGERGREAGLLVGGGDAVGVVGPEARPPSCWS